MGTKIQRASSKPKGREPNDKVFTLTASGSGQVMLLICVAIFALMGMIAVVADFSFMQHQRNMMQTAADSAAMAGAEELNYGDLVAAGKADAATNGYADGAGSVTVAINNPPGTGPNAGNTAYVEATISKPEPTYFLSVIGINTMTVSVRAVAYEGNGPNCIYVTDPSAAPAMSNNGNVTVQSNCGLLVDSSASNALAANRQRVDQRADDRSGGELHNFGRRQLYAHAEDRGDSGVGSAGLRTGADGGVVRAHQFPTQWNVGQRRQSVRALRRHLLRRNLDQRQCVVAFQ